MVTVVIDDPAVVHRSHTIALGAKVPTRWQRGHCPPLRAFLRVTLLAAGVSGVFRVFIVHSLSGQRRSGQGWQPGIRFCADIVGALDEGVWHYRATPGRVKFPSGSSRCGGWLFLVAAAVADRGLLADRQHQVASAVAAGLERLAGPLSLDPPSLEYFSPSLAPAHHHCHLPSRPGHRECFRLMRVLGVLSCSGDSGFEVPRALVRVPGQVHRLVVVAVVGRCDSVVDHC
jgi:hypothetical protein